MIRLRAEEEKPARKPDVALESRQLRKPHRRASHRPVDSAHTVCHNITCATELNGFARLQRVEDDTEMSSVSTPRGTVLATPVATPAKEVVVETPSKELPRPRYGKVSVFAAVDEITQESFDAMLLSERSTVFAQRDFRPEMVTMAMQDRAVLLDWMAEVCVWFKMCSQTFFIAANLIDTYYVRTTAHRATLQLSGLAALFSAAKFEEVDVPKAAKFAAMLPRCPSTATLNQAALDLLCAIGFDFNTATPAAFFSCIQSLDALDSTPESLAARRTAFLMCKMSMLNAHSRSFLPSVLGCACWSLARELADYSPWSPELEAFTGYAEPALATCRQFVVTNLDFMKKERGSSPMFQLHFTDEF